MFSFEHGEKLVAYSLQCNEYTCIHVMYVYFVLVEHRHAYYVNRENNSIQIWNNGTGIPVVKHRVEGLYVPTLIFGHLLTSSNYDDTERKVTGVCHLSGSVYFPIRVCAFVNLSHVFHVFDKFTFY